MLREDIRIEALHDDFDATKYTTFLNRWIDEGQRRIVRRLRLRTEEAVSDLATVSGTATLTVPADFAHLRALFDVDFQRELEQLSLTDWQAEASANIRGRPTGFAFDRTNFVLMPTPDAIYTVRVLYWKVPPVLADGQSPQIHEDMHPLIVLWCRHRLFAREDDAAMANFYRQQFDAEITELGGSLAHESSSGPKQMMGVHSGYYY